MILVLFSSLIGGKKNPTTIEIVIKIILFAHAIFSRSGFVKFYEIKSRKLVKANAIDRSHEAH